MLNSPKSNLVNADLLQKQLVFAIDRYKFTGVPLGNGQCIKTSTNRKITNQDILNVTRLHHPNLIALKKIGKSKKNGQEGLFWLYYESIPYNLELVFLRTNFDITSQAVEAALISLKNYLTSFNICPSLYEFNIGVNQFGEIKIYVSIQNILKRDFSIQKQLAICQNKIKQIRRWYGNIYSRRSYKPNQLPKSISDKQLLNTNINKIQQIKEDLEKLRKQMRSQQSKNGSVIQTPITNKNNFRNTNFNHKHQPSADLKDNNIRLLSKVLQKNHKNQLNSHSYDNQIVNVYQLNAAKKALQYDNESVDTYQMEMGEDFEMPSIRTNQKLRQTVINDKKSWDTLTCKAPTTNKQKISESAGKNDFMKIIQNNKRVLKESALKRMDSYSDSKTIQDNLRQRNWQTSTIKSALPPNIQDRVQQALAKTKNVMQMLKITKSFSAGK